MVGKRKRADNAEEGEGREVNGDSSANQQERFHNWLLDVLDILKEQDTSPSTFDRSITSSTQPSHDSKRTKLSEIPEKTTIASLIETKAYTTIENMVKDMDTATAGIVKDLQEAMNDDQGCFIHRELQTQISRATALKKSLDKFLLTEMIRRPSTIISSRGIKDEPSDDEDTKVKIDDSRDNVLTLLADTRPPKQLFTSIRKTDGPSQPLSEFVLPNGIATTRIIPQHSINEDGKKPVPTLKDLFGPPSSLPPLPVPKQSRHTVTRSSSVNWYNPAETETKSKSSRRESYTTQGISTGQWLTYNVAPSPDQLASPESKRKQRDRALSVGESQNSVSQEAIAAYNQAKGDALFRSAYSSFAPDRDDSGAMVAEQQKNHLWWRKYGESKYQELLEPRDEGIDGSEAMETNGVADEDKLDEEELERTIANWKPEEAPSEMLKSDASKDGPPETSNEADALLQEISDLLETLQSHQRLRHMTLATGARPIAGQNPQLTTLAASPTSPSTAEFDVYEILKAQLALIVSTLPPYMLSKLDGDKLGALKISSKIQVESKNQRGNMEESDASTSARAPTRSAAPAGTTQTASPYSNVPGRSNSYLQSTTTPAQQYPRSGYGAATAPRPAANSSYLQNPAYSNRPASSNYSSGSARSSYPAQGGYPPQAATSASTSRYNYAQQFGQQQSQSSYGSYQNGYRPYSGQNASSYNYNAQYSTPQPRAPSNPAQASQAYRGNQTEYQQRAVPPQGYGYGSAQAGGSASPQTQQRGSFSGPTQTTNQQRPQLYHQHSSQYHSSTPASPQINGTGTPGPATQQGHMTANEQATLMNRQKAQLAEQQSSRQGSGTPQPPSRQYSPQQNGQQHNGTPVPQQNGIAAGQA